MTQAVSKCAQHIQMAWAHRSQRTDILLKLFVAAAYSIGLRAAPALVLKISVVAVGAATAVFLLHYIFTKCFSTPPEDQPLSPRLSRLDGFLQMPTMAAILDVLWPLPTFADIKLTRACRQFSHMTDAAR